MISATLLPQQGTLHMKGESRMLGSWGRMGAKKTRILVSNKCADPIPREFAFEGPLLRTARRKKGTADVRVMLLHGEAAMRDDHGKVE